MPHIGIDCLTTCHRQDDRTHGQECNIGLLYHKIESPMRTDHGQHKWRLRNTP